MPLITVLEHLRQKLCFSEYVQWKSRQ